MNAMYSCMVLNNDKNIIYKLWFFNIQYIFEIPGIRYLYLIQNF